MTLSKKPKAGSEDRRDSRQASKPTGGKALPTRRLKEAFSPRKETARGKKERCRQISGILATVYANAECALHHDSPYQLVVATILSAQCTDERVNKVTPELFRRFPDFESLANATQDDVETIVQSTGFFRAKASNLRKMAKAVVEEHGGQLPQSLEEMVRLPGVGRKTANVVLGTAFGLPTGVVVDTHVKRITGLLGLTRSKNPEQIERELIDLLPESEWINFSHRLIHHGRRICIARRPRCGECPLLDVCFRVGLPPLEESL